MIHILFTHAAKQAFMEAIEDEKSPLSGEVIIYEPYLQLGLLQDQQQRMKQLDQIFGLQSTEDEREKILTEFKQIERSIQEEIESGNEVNAWIGEEAADELAFLSIVSRIKEIEDENLFIHRVRGKLLVRELLPENIEGHLNAVLITNDMLEQMKEAWKRVTEKPNELRVRRADFVYDFHAFDYVDEVLLSHVKKEEPTAVVSIVGSMYGSFPYIPFPFFLWRTHTLLEKRVIKKVEENEDPMRNKVILT